MKAIVGVVETREDGQWFIPLSYDYTKIRLPMKVKNGEGIIYVNKKGKIKRYRNIDPRKITKSDIKWIDNYFDKLRSSLESKTNNTNLFIDDEREPPESWGSYKYVVLRSYDSVIEFITEFGCPMFISFDHDLGTGKSGLDIAKKLIDIDLNRNGEFIPNNFNFTVHSMNPVGAKNIEYLLNQYLNSKRKTQVF